MVAKIPWLSIGRFALIVLCLAIVLVLVVTLLPIYLDVTALKGPIEEILSAIAEAPVTIEEARLHPSLSPSLVVAGVDVAGSRGEDSPRFSRIDRLEVKLALLPLLRKQIRLKRLFVSGASFHAHRPEGGVGNWPVWTSSGYRVAELAGIELQNVTLELEDHRTVRARAVIDHLTCDIARKRPLNLRLQGSFEDRPLTLSASGPTLAIPLSQASDFPLSLEIALADLQLHLEGSTSREPGGAKFQFGFDLETTDMSLLTELGGMSWPKIDGSRLSGLLSNRESALEITGLKGSVGSTTVRGRLALDLPGDRRVLTGRLAFGELALEPWLEHAKGSPSASDTHLPFDSLAVLDADLELTLQSLTGLGVTVENLTLEAQLIDGILILPIEVLVADIPVTARLGARVVVDDPAVSAKVMTQGLSLDQLEPLVEVSENLKGSFGSVELDLRSTGYSVEELRQNLFLEITTRDATMTLDDEAEDKSVDLVLSRVQATQRPHEPLTATIEGRLLEEPFTLELQTASLAALRTGDTWPLQIRLQGAGADLDLAGSLGRRDTGIDLDVEIGLEGERLGELDKWLGLPPEAELPYRLRGNLVTDASSRSLHIQESSIGNTRFEGSFAWDVAKESQPLLADLHAFSLDLPELRDLSDPVTDLGAKEKAVGVELPVLPTRMHFFDAEINLTADRLLRQTVDLTDVSATFHFRQGALERSPFAFVHDRQEFYGTIDLDFREDVPRFALDLHGEGENLGELLEAEQIFDDIDVTADRLDLRIDASGETIRTILSTADVSGQLLNARWQIHLPEADRDVEVHMERLELKGPKGKPIVLTASGFLEQEPLDLRLEVRTANPDKHKTAQSMPFHLSTNLAATTLDLEGELHLPIKTHEIDVRMALEGESLSTLSPLFGRDLPPLGPYRLEGLLALHESDYSLRSIDLRVGESDLQGEISYRRVEERPTFTADLTSGRIDSEEIFRHRHQKTAAGEDPDTEKPDPPAGRPRLSLESFKDVDASIDLRVDELITWGGAIEGLVIDADLHRGNLDLLLKRPHEDNRDALFSARIRPLEQGLDAHLDAYWIRHPYGLLTALITPGAEGSLSLNLDLDTHGSTLDELTSNLEGSVAFANYPADVHAPVLDLWGGGLFNSLLPVFQLGDESRLNCSVGRFNVAQGVMTPDPLIIDTTRSRISAKGSIDLPGHEFRLRLKPRPKKRNLINLATPVSVTGPLNDPQVQVTKGGLAMTFFRLSLWVYTVWRDLARKPLPADGHDICADPFAQFPTDRRAEGE